MFSAILSTGFASRSYDYVKLALWVREFMLAFKIDLCLSLKTLFLYLDELPELSLRVTLSGELAFKKSILRLDLMLPLIPRFFVSLKNIFEVRIVEDRDCFLW